MTFEPECTHEECGTALCDRRVRAERVIDSFRAPTFCTINRQEVNRGAVLRLVAGGYTFAQTAAWFNVPRLAVVAVVTKAFTDDQAEEALQCFREQSHGDRSIATRFGLKRFQVTTLREALCLSGFTREKVA